MSPSTATIDTTGEFFTDMKCVRVGVTNTIIPRVLEWSVER